jgi:hypothetical protein
VRTAGCPFDPPRRLLELDADKPRACMLSKPFTVKRIEATPSNDAYKRLRRTRTRRMTPDRRAARAISWQNSQHREALSSSGRDSTCYNPGGHNRMPAWRRQTPTADSTHTNKVVREVGAELEVEVTKATKLVFQIAVAHQPGIDVSESLAIKLNGKRIEPREIVGMHDTRIHVVQADEGTVTLSYAATVVGQADPVQVSDIDLISYLRPSRYAEADKFFGFAATEFQQYGTTITLLEKVSSWVGTRLSYVPGSSDPIDGAADTLLAGAGVCRDYAHLVIALLRALGVPARLVAVYAPGCQPMDFHAVTEAFVDGAWRVADATCLAPRQSMVRIATGRDAADTAFLDNHKGAITLQNMTVAAVVDGELPRDSIDQLVSLR